MTQDLTPCRPLLDRDPILYLDLTETLRRGEGTLVHACPTGALMSYRNYENESGETGFTMAAADRPTAEYLCGLLPPDTGFLIVHEDFCFSLLRERFGFQLGRPCWQVARMDPTPLPLPAAELEVRPLEPRHLPQVAAHYHLAEEGYLTWLLGRGELYGAFRGEALWGFIGRHAEGTIGLLEVLPQYRRRGVATLLQSFLANLELSRGNIPYGQVFDGNLASLALQARLGFRRSLGPLYWAVRDQ